MSTLHASSAVKKASSGASQRFPGTARLLKHADFQTVYQQGRKHFSGNMVAFYHASGGSQRARVGFTVGRVLGGAVDRNRIRRRMRAAVSRHLTELVKPLDLVLHPRKSVLTMDFAELAAEISRVFSAVQREKGNESSEPGLRGELLASEAREGVLRGNRRRLGAKRQNIKVQRGKGK